MTTIKTWSQRITPESTAVEQLRAMQAEINELRSELKRACSCRWVDGVNTEQCKIHGAWCDCLYEQRDYRVERDLLRSENERLIEQGANMLGIADERNVLQAELEDCAAALPGPYYMDPPDGGSVPVSEQLGRMAKDSERYRWMTRQIVGDTMEALEAAFATFCDEEKCTQQEFDAAIDAARAET